MFTDDFPFKLKKYSIFKKFSSSNVKNSGCSFTPGYKVFCCGQPTKEGFIKACEKVCEKWPKDGKIIWINMRQEPVIYVNGNPVCARPPNKIGEYAELGNVTRKS